MHFPKGIRDQFLRLLHDEEGATAVEYGLIVSLVVIASLTALQGVADENTGLWAVVKAKITEAFEDIA